MDAFEAVARTASVTHAAKLLQMGQTGVTQRVRNLERELKTTLFLRSRRGMQLTESGQALLRYCDVTRQQEGQLLSAIHGAGETSIQRLVVTGPSSVLRSRFVSALTEVAIEFPNLRLTLDLSDTISGIEKLRSGFAHLALVRRNEIVHEIDSKILRPERYVLVGPSAWKVRNIKEILRTEPIIDFDPSDTMTIEYLRKFKLAHHWQGERHFANNTDALASFVAGGMGFSVLSEDFAEKYICNGDLIQLNQGKAFEYPVALAWYPRTEMPKWLSAAIKYLLRA
ncbi:MAG: LysR family transcriptional regulator [Proteobacteria bacterium]|nr:LysR family transcriptional regulator [Pseudomonadota bacterium]